MLERAGRVLGDWAQDRTIGGLADLHLSVNLSGRHVDHPSVIEDVTGLWDSWSLETSKRIVEITETTTTKDLDGAAETMGQPREAHVPISIAECGVANGRARGRERG